MGDIKEVELKTILDGAASELSSIGSSIDNLPFEQLLEELAAIRDQLIEATRAAERQANAVELNALLNFLATWVQNDGEPELSSRQIRQEAKRRLAQLLVPRGLAREARDRESGEG